MLILGLAYRGGVKEATLSSALLVAEALRRRGARVLGARPLVHDREIASYGLEAVDVAASSSPSTPSSFRPLHPEYATWTCTVVRRAAASSWTAARAFDRERVEAAGMRYWRSARPIET